MMKAACTFFVLCMLYQNIKAQPTSVDALVANIPQSNTTSVQSLSDYIKQTFEQDSARLRAIYVWVASNISYDMELLKRRDKEPNMPPQPVSEVLKTRSAVCQGYADLFVQLCKASGINATVVGGYTKDRLGKLSPLAHAWAAAELDGAWYLFDPTWGAGYVRGDRFEKAFNNRYYKLPAQAMIKDHMPFDPMNQFLTVPINAKAFMEDKITITSGGNFNYADTLRQHAQLSPAQKAAAELRRLEAGGVGNNLLEDRQRWLKKVLQDVASKDAVEEGGIYFGKALQLHKQYITHKNKQFATTNDAALKQMVDNMSDNLRQARILLTGAQPENASQREAVAANAASIEQFSKLVQKEKDFVDKYLSTDTSKRMQLFMRSR